MQRTNTATRNPAWQIALLAGALTLMTGCGGSLGPGSGTHPASVKLKGRLFGGQFPISGAEVQLYAAGTTGYGVHAHALLSPAAVTDADGNFSIADGAYTCPSSDTPAYLVATGGDPGVGADNPAIAMMAALGPCGDIGSLPSVNINEVTTVASVWPLAQFLGAGAQVGTSSTNMQGLTNAFANVNNVVDITQGVAPGSSLPAGAVVPVQKIYTLANILAACINSTGTQACNTLFSAATPSAGSAPTNTLDAARNIALNPTLSIAALFATPTPSAPFQPSLAAAPPDWTIRVTYNGGGLKYPASIAVDAQGNVWTSNYCGSNSPCSSVTEISSAGQPLSPSNGFTDGSLWENYGLTIDFHGNVWVTNEQTTGVNGGHGSIAELNSSGQLISTSGGYYGGGIDFPIAIATDTDGSVWVANQGDSTASKFSNAGLALSPGSGWGSGAGVAGPSGVAIDASHRAWFANQEAASGSVTGISSDGSQITTIQSGGYESSGLATDSIGISTNASKGHLWVTNYSSSSVSEVELNTNGSTTVLSTGYTGGGINHPNGIAVDGAGNVWVANHGGNSLTELEGADSATPGKTLSPASGFGADANLRQPFGVALDASGNAWVSNFGLSTVTQFLGVASPVKTPLIGPAQAP